MGFFGSLGRGILGAGVGFLTGGPVGAAAGGVSGLLSGDSAGRTTNTSNATSNTATRQTELRDFDTQEQQVVDQAYRGLTSQGPGVDTGEIRDRLYGLSSGAINERYEADAARDYSNRASRGAASSSAGDVRQDRQTALQSRELGRASDRAYISAEELAMRERANQQAEAREYMGRLNSMWNRQLQGSKITTTSSGSSSGQAVAPDTFLPSVAAGLGYAVGNDNSYLNNDLLGGI